MPRPQQSVLPAARASPPLALSFGADRAPCPAVRAPPSSPSPRAQPPAGHSLFSLFSPLSIYVHVQCTRSSSSSKRLARDALRITSTVGIPTSTVNMTVNRIVRVDGSTVLLPARRTQPVDLGSSTISRISHARAAGSAGCR